MSTRRSPGQALTAERTAPIHRLMQVVTATSLVAVCPIAAVWWLRSSGVLTAYIPGMAVGVALAFGAAQAGRAFWQTRPGSEHVLFSELMVWGFIHRSYSDRRLASARAVLGTMSQAQRRLEDGLSPERQTKLLEQLARAMDARDPKTHGHSRRVARYSWMIAMRMGLTREQVARIRTAAAVHDVGKFGTPLSILRKEGLLDDGQFEIMKRHPVDGAQLVSVLNDEGLTAMVRHHHERLDGTGYPDRLTGDEIPLGARIIAVADTFDAITAHRPYRAARPHREALAVLTREAGKQLDPDVVRAFCGHYSGRRPLTFWTSFATLPERALAQLGSGVGTVAAAAKVATLATLLGALAAGTATLAHPSRASGGEALGRGLAAVTSPGHSSVPATSGTALPVLDPARPGAARRPRANGGAPHGTVSVGSAPAGDTPAAMDGPGASASPESPAVAGSPAPAEGTGPGVGAGSGPAGGSGGGGRSEGTGESSPHTGAVGEVTAAATGTVGEVAGAAGGVVRGAGADVGGAVGETVEGVGATLTEAGGHVGEIAAPVTGAAGAAVEALPGKVTEVRGGLGGVVGSLKL